MILIREHILAAMERGDITISGPGFDPDKQVGTNSVDLRLGDTLKVMGRRSHYEETAVVQGNKTFPALRLFHANHNVLLDTRKENDNFPIHMPDDGYVLMPGILYLASTVEYTENPVYVPEIWGKSSLARLGFTIHQTAGFGDIGFKGHWTLELSVLHPLVIYPGMKICQVVYHEPSGRTSHGYDTKPDAKYSGQGAAPQTSKNHENFTQP